MFEKKDFDQLGEVFAAARAHLANAQPQNREGMVGILNFEVELKEKIVALIPQEDLDKMKASPSKEGEGEHKTED